MTRYTILAETTLLPLEKTLDTTTLISATNLEGKPASLAFSAGIFYSCFVSSSSDEKPAYASSRTLFPEVDCEAGA
jgi:hypothetical protein